MMLDVITFGGHSRKLYREIHASFHKGIEETREAVIKADNAKLTYENKPVRATVITPFKGSDPVFQKEIFELSTNPSFQWLVFSAQQDIYEMLNNATGDKAIEIMGMSKGMAHFKAVVTEICSERQLSMEKSEHQNSQEVEID